MPTFHDPVKDADEVRQALLGLAHATRTIEHPATVYDLLGPLASSLASLEQALHQVGAFHYALRRHDIRPVVADSVRGGAAASYQVSWELHRAAAMTHQIAAAVDRAREVEATIAYSRPVDPTAHSTATPGISP